MDSDDMKTTGKNGNRGTMTKYCERVHTREWRLRLWLGFFVLFCFIGERLYNGGKSIVLSHEPTNRKMPRVYVCLGRIWFPLFNYVAFFY